VGGSGGNSTSWLLSQSKNTNVDGSCGNSVSLFLPQHSIVNVGGNGGNDVSLLLLQYNTFNVGRSSKNRGGNSVKPKPRKSNVLSRIFAILSLAISIWRLIDI
jgi:hypothetical protein